MVEPSKKPGTNSKCYVTITNTRTGKSRHVTVRGIRPDRLLKRIKQIAAEQRAA